MIFGKKIFISLGWTITAMTETAPFLPDKGDRKVYADDSENLQSDRIKDYVEEGACKCHFRKKSNYLRRNFLIRTSRWGVQISVTFWQVRKKIRRLSCCAEAWTTAECGTSM
jgi:hypothetical protein